MSIFEKNLSTFGGKSTTGKSSIPDDDYEAICVGVADAGIKEQTYDGKVSKAQQVVLIWQVDFVNGFGSHTILTDFAKPSNHENSRWTKEFLKPTKLKVDTLKSLIGARARVEVTTSNDGYPQISRYLASKKPIEVADDIYIPTWIFTKEYPILKHDKVKAGPRPVKAKEGVAIGAGKAKVVQQEAELADVDPLNELPF